MPEARDWLFRYRLLQGHTLFACTVGDLGGFQGVGDVSLDSWTCLEGMIAVVRRTGHSSFYVEKGMGAMGKTPKQLGIQGEYRINGGAFPIWLENAPCCPIAVVACYSGSTSDDHHLVVNGIRDYLKKMQRDSQPPQPPPPPSTSSAVPIPAASTERTDRESTVSRTATSWRSSQDLRHSSSQMWVREPAASTLMHGHHHQEYSQSHEIDHDQDYDH
ncbi:hypothetical protein QCA50_000202 [Cerrena zonata]|uniref:Profilin n=1 Tax=Cerrena zonata TaxID=2478898 RepID=A0AAW0GZL2_9APHY